MGVDGGTQLGQELVVAWMPTSTSGSLCSGSGDPMMGSDRPKVAQQTATEVVARNVILFGIAKTPITPKCDRLQL